MLIEPTSLFLGFMIGMGVMYTILIIYQIAVKNTEERMIWRLIKIQREGKIKWKNLKSKP